MIIRTTGRTETKQVAGDTHSNTRRSPDDDRQVILIIKREVNVTGLTDPSLTPALQCCQAMDRQIAIAGSASCFHPTSVCVYIHPKM